MGLVVRRSRHKTSTHRCKVSAPAGLRRAPVQTDSSHRPWDPARCSVRPGKRAAQPQVLRVSQPALARAFNPLGLCCPARSRVLLAGGAPSSSSPCGAQGFCLLPSGRPNRLPPVAAHRLLVAVASLAAEHGLQEFFIYSGDGSSVDYSQFSIFSKSCSMWSPGTLTQLSWIIVFSPTRAHRRWLGRTDPAGSTIARPGRSPPGTGPPQWGPSGLLHAGHWVQQALGRGHENRKVTPRSTREETRSSGAGRRLFWK
nr:uncharacterized protein LOC112586269 isoform X2 [Bubalus bubalis]